MAIIDGTAGNDTLNGTPDADTITGFEGDDTLDGLGGDDLLRGGAGTDTMAGGTGNDTYYVSEASDVIVEVAGEGQDRLLADTDYVLAAGVSVEILATRNGTRTTAIDLTGNELANRIYGNAGNNVLSGGAGDDMLFGGGGTDTFVGGTGADLFWVNDATDVIVEAADEGKDTVRASADYTLAPGVSVEVMATTDGNATTPINLTGNQFNQSLYGNAGNNILSGGSGNDYLVGGAGNDTLVGGSGVDNLMGGAGDDIFLYNAIADSAGSPMDQIVDFTSGEDIIDLSAADASSVAGNQAFTFIGTAAFSNTAGELRVFWDGEQWIIEGDTNGDGFANLMIAVTSPIELTAIDFIL